MIPVIIDTDPGIDDAVALAFALYSEEMDVRLITTVAGNVDVQKTTKNTLKLLEFFGKNVPVAVGAQKPLLRPFSDSSDIHGDSGLDGYDFKEPVKKPLEIHAVEAMRLLLNDSTEKVTIVAIAPLTNIALLLSLYPECAQKIDRIVMMGGSTERGNKMPAAEFNIYVDPEAAKIVFHSGVKITMCGLNVTNRAILAENEINKMQDMNRVSSMFLDLFGHYRGGSVKNGLKMHDLCAVAFILKPELFTVQESFVEVETAGTFTSGCTVVDLNNKMGFLPNACVCVDINVAEFQKWFLESLGSM